MMVLFFSKSLRACVVLICVFGVTQPEDQLSQCTLQGGGCTYNVVLTNQCGSPVLSNQLQNDNDQLVSDMQRDLLDVRLDHTRRLAELEKIINRMFYESEGEKRGSGRNRKNSGQSVHEVKYKKKRISFKENLGRNENALMNQLHKEFVSLRKDLMHTRRRLKETDRLLSETRRTLNKTEHELQMTRTKLRETERQLEMSLAENIQMQKQCEATQIELNTTKTKLQDSEKLLRRKDIEIWREQSEKEDLRKELEACHQDLADARQALEQALVKYHELNLRHENTTAELQRTHGQLVECYQGKTSQYCGFEDESICGFEQDNETDSQDWVRWNMATASANTGPTVDHTCQNERGFYMYVEATTISGGRRARLVSQLYMGHTNQCVEFYYHMYGKDTGTLNVVTIIPGVNAVPVWRAFGDQGDVWTLARIQIHERVTAAGYKVAFEAILEKGSAGDIAIDDFRVFDGNCYPKRVSTTFDRKAATNRNKIAPPKVTRGDGVNSGHE